MRREAALLSTLALAACDTRVIQAVSAPGYRTGQGCVAAELAGGGAQRCTSAAALAFDQPGADAEVSIASGNLSDKQVSCRRSFCGAGSLSLHAVYTWKLGVEPASDQKLGEIRYRLPQTTELYGHKLRYALYLDGPTTPVNAYIAVEDQTGRFRMIDDQAVYVYRQWTERGGTVDQDNGKLRLEPGTTSLLADEIIIAVYLSTEVRTGDAEHWSAELYIDEISW